MGQAYITRRGGTAPKILVHCTGQAGETVTATLGDKQVTGTLGADGTGTLLLPCTGVWAVTFGNGITQYVEAYFYGEYALMDKPYLYKPGDVCETVTGGWQARALPYHAPGSQYFAYGIKPGLIFNSDTMVTSYYTSLSYAGAIETVRDIDLTRYSRICIRCSAVATSTGSFYMAALPRASAYFIQAPAASICLSYNQSYATKTMQFDVSKVTGAYDIAIATLSANATSTLTINEIWLEG